MKSNQILERIKQLPQVIQDLIWEYNVEEHRNHLEKLQKEYFGIIYKKCRECNYISKNHDFWSIDYFIDIKYNLTCFWCSDTCFNRDKNEEVKDKYKSSVDHYLSNVTLQLPKQNLQL